VPRRLKRYQQEKDLHFITFSCYRRLPLLGTAQRRDLFLRVLEETRRRYQWVICGYVVMPEHVHLLVNEPEVSTVAGALKALKQGVARRVMGRPRIMSQHELCPNQTGIRHFWQARYYDFNVWTDKKRIQKLRYIHRNPVARGLVETPEQWRWSSFRHYALGEKGIVAVNAIFPPNWARYKDK
jgi:putative transposase